MLVVTFHMLAKPSCCLNAVRIGKDVPELHKLTLPAPSSSNVWLFYIKKIRLLLNNCGLLTPSSHIVVVQQFSENALKPIL